VKTNNLKPGATIIRRGHTWLCQVPGHLAQTFSTRGSARLYATWLGYRPTVRKS
jgi:hypothetical protein